MALGGRLFQGVADALGLERRLAAAARRACDEALAALALVPRTDAEALGARVDALAREVAGLADSVSAVRQAVDAWAIDLDDDLSIWLDGTPIAPRLDRLEAGLADTEARVARLGGAQGVLDARLADAATRTEHTRARVEQALQAAVTARATAEAAVDGALG